MDAHASLYSLISPCRPTYKHTVWICANTNPTLSVQTDPVTVTSHIAHHTQVSSAFTCSSVQQGLYAAASVGRRGSKCIQRAPAETTEAHVLLLLLLCSWPGGGEHRGWWRRVSRFKRIFFSLPFLPNWIRANTNTTQGCVCVCVYVCICAVYVYYSISNRDWTVHKAPSVCVCCSYPGRQWRVACSVLITTWSHQSLYDSTVCLNTCACVYTVWKCVYESGKVTWSRYVTQSKQFVPYVLCYPGLYSLSYNRSPLFKTPAQCACVTWWNRARSGDTTLGSDRGAI